LRWRRMAGLHTSGGIDWQITDLHGDLVATVTNNDARSATGRRQDSRRQVVDRRA
jgi:hypothetical protein